MSSSSSSSSSNTGGKNAVPPQLTGAAAQRRRRRSWERRIRTMPVSLRKIRKEDIVKVRDDRDRGLVCSD